MSLTLTEFAERGDNVENETLSVRIKDVTPKMLQVVTKLERLGLLRDEVVLSLLGQAPIDPIGLYGAMKDMGTWAFDALDFMMVQVLAKKGNKPVAAMRLDLLSDDLTFMVLRDNQLVTHATVTADMVTSWLTEHDMTQEKLLARLTAHMKAAVDEGLANA